MNKGGGTKKVKEGESERQTWERGMRSGDPKTRGVLLGEIKKKGQNKGTRRRSLRVGAICAK